MVAIVVLVVADVVTTVVTTVLAGVKLPLTKGTVVVVTFVPKTGTGLTGVATVEVVVVVTVPKVFFEPIDPFLLDKFHEYI